MTSHVIDIQTTSQATGGLARRLLAAINGAAGRIGAVLVESSDLMRCSREAERLFQLSDAELAKLGIRRDGVVNHAFARYLY